MSEQLVELAYSKFASHYSSRNWISNEPLWSQLSEKDKTFWINFINGVRYNFKMEQSSKIEKVDKAL